MTGCNPAAGSTDLRRETCKRVRSGGRSKCTAALISEVGAEAWEVGVGEGMDGWMLQWGGDFFFSSSSKKGCPCTGFSSGGGGGSGEPSMQQPIDD